MRSILIAILSAIGLFQANSPATAPPVTLNTDVSLPKITLDAISQTDHSWTATLSAEKTFTLIVTGDVLLARTINSRAVSSRDFEFPFLPTAKFISSADTTFINLETPLFSGCPTSTEGTVFCGVSEHTAGLKLAGVDIVSLANNHAFDYLETGFNSSLELLTANNLAAIYAGHPYATKTKNLRISYHAFNDIWSRSKIYSRVDIPQMEEELKAAKANSDLVISMFHWGNEYTETISPRQQLLAHAAIDAGADLVIGSHPHWIQGSEIYQGKLISYSLGNFIFDQYWSQKTRQGQIAKYTFWGNQLVDVEYFLVYMQTNGQTVQKEIQ